MNTNQYIKSISQRYKLGNSTEHTFRGDLQNLIEGLQPQIRATNEPKRQECGAPDYILTRKDIPVGFIEAKDIGDSDLDGLRKSGNKEQFDRYKSSLNNLIFTDYLSFHWYRDGELVQQISIGKVFGDKVQPIEESFEEFKNLLDSFCTKKGRTISSPKKLANVMAGKARMLASIIDKALTKDEKEGNNTSLIDQMLAFKEILIHDITPKGFADVYAQTIAYGMFAARLNDTSLDTFSRQEAAGLIPKSNPFLRKLFQYIAGYDLDDRIKWIVDDLVQIFLACDVEKMLRNYGKSTKMEDPIIHFYEDFLSEYDSKLRKARGVWYTPQPVVNFIVRAVDDILKDEFNLSQGLANTSKTKITTKHYSKKTADRRSKLKEVEETKEVHKVQILDPATGTGTFLSEVIKEVYKKFEGQQGVWSNYVEEHLIPRVNGFELLMASYAMAHLKLDLQLKETGFEKDTDQRFRVYLTNSLEEHHQDTGTLFANWLSGEANEANHIKRDSPVMCIIGNPPYSGESANKGDWIMKLMEDYKKEPGGKEKLKEQNSKFINDDYVKFMRYGQHYIEKNGSGVLAFINPHGFLDNPTFRGMRWNLLKTYDKIYTIDLHGNSKKNETAPDGGEDVNVFDIQQGVSINILIKTGKKESKELGKVFHYDLFGKRDFKYDFLTDNSINSINFNELPNLGPQYFFVQKDFKSKKVYDKGFSIKSIFNVGTIGVLSKNDKLAIQFSETELENILEDFHELNEEELRVKHSVKKDSRDWKLSYAKNDVIENIETTKISKINYRPFDQRFTFLSGKGKGFVAYSQNKVRLPMNNENLGLICVRQLASLPFNHIFITDIITDQCFISSRTKEGGVIMPLYLYNEENGQETFEETLVRKPNLDSDIVKQIAESLNLQFIPDHKDVRLDPGQHNKYFSPLDILDYIYAVLHSSSYREKYKEFLKIDFPRVPYPRDKDIFWKLVNLGAEIRQIHLMESHTIGKPITQYHIGGSNEVSRKITNSSPGYEAVNDTHGKVYINDEQYFDNVPLTAWEYHIGGYQPAQKWLKDRKGRTLGFEDIKHYQKIIVVLTETDRLMNEIDEIEV